MDLSTGKPIDLTDKSLFDEYFTKYPPENSEFTFTNLYMWRNYYNFLFMEYKEHIILFSYDYLRNRRRPIIKDSKDYVYFFPPIGPSPDKIIIELFENLGNLEVHRVPEDICEILNANQKFNELNLVCLEDRNNWDYVYNKDEILHLVGNKYRQNRRWLHKFLSNYNYDFKLLTEDLVEKCKELQLKWCEERECRKVKDLLLEQEAIYEALNNFEKLDFSGGILCVNEKCVAYTLGEKLNENTIVIHVEKAHLDYMGSYQAINNLFLKKYEKESTYVNREQDLGIEGLRRAKESYKPIKMVKKSIIYSIVS